MSGSEKLVNKKMVLAINKLVIRMSGGQPFSGTRNMFPNASLSFIETIQMNNLYGQTPFPTIHHKAAAYVYYILKNHIFIDGNKRTALATAVTYLEWNDFCFAPQNDDDVYDHIKKYAVNDAPPEVLIPRIAQWLRGICLD